MRSLYEIRNDIEHIFDEIDNNDGIITNEQVIQLTIRQEELKDKLDAYRHIIGRYNSDVNYCKEEETRIALVRKRNQKIVDRLKYLMIDALLRYGDTNKSGNKFVEFADGKVMTRATRVIEINDDVARHFRAVVMERLLELYNNGMLETVDVGSGVEVQSLDLEGFIQTVNLNYAAQYPQEYEELENPFTVDDLYNYGIKIEFELTLADLCKVENYDITNAMFNHKSTVSDDFNKTLIKHELDNGAKISIVKQCINQSLQIK